MFSGPDEGHDAWRVAAPDRIGVVLTQGSGLLDSGPVVPRVPDEEERKVGRLARPAMRAVTAVFCVRGQFVRVNQRVHVFVRNRARL